MNHNRKNNENLILENSKYIVLLLIYLQITMIYFVSFVLTSFECNCTVPDLSSKNSSGTKLLFKLLNSRGTTRSKIFFGGKRTKVLRRVEIYISSK